ncbi:SIS domain-containing protein [Candidatus Flexifilum breve]|uniref:SIS domain-containing protein n=1 Tax=Candidatus Flexifilum breve TaxID=3140694 RepID=UPI0031CC4C3C
MFTGCGSTYYAGMVEQRSSQAGTGITARAVSATELMLFPEMIVSAHRTALLICVSRSGTTRETVACPAETKLKDLAGGHSIIFLTCESGNPLAQTADVLVAIDAAQEESRVQTRSL